MHVCWLSQGFCWSLFKNAVSSISLGRFKAVLEVSQLLSDTYSCCLLHFGRLGKTHNAELCWLDVVCGAELV